MTCNRNCDCVGECKAGNEKPTTTTPTPGDLSARLLACPFCGGVAERIDFGPGAGDNEGGSCIACTKCQASGPVEFGYKENFVSNWNRRAALSALPAAGGEWPLFTWSGLAPRKLGELRKQGWAVNGYALYRNGERGLIDLHGAVHWIAAPAAGKGVDDAMVESLRELADELENAQASSHLGSLHAAGVVAGCRSAADRIRTLIGGQP